MHLPKIESIFRFNPVAGFIATLLTITVLVPCTQAQQRGPLLPEQTEIHFSGDSTARWEGALPEGGTLQIKNMRGDIQTETTGGSNVVITARRSGAKSDSARVVLVRGEDGKATVCALLPDEAAAERSSYYGFGSLLEFFGLDQDATAGTVRVGSGDESVATIGEPASSRLKSCRPGKEEGYLGGRGKVDVRVDFEVRLSSDISLSAHTVVGDIRAQSGGNVHAESTTGDLDIRAGGWAAGETTDGNLTVAMGRTNWRGTRVLETTAGNISVALPTEANLNVEAETSAGSIRSYLPSLEASGLVGAEVHGALGTGGQGRHLLIKTTRGDISLRKRTSSIN